MSAKKNILIITIGLDGGGAEKIVTTLAENLHTVFNLHLVTFKNSGIYLDRVKSVLGNSCRALDIVERNTIKKVLVIRKIIKEIQPDKIISFLYYPNLVTFLANLALGTEHIACERSCHRFYFKPRVKDYIWKFLMYFMYKQARYIVAISTRMAEFIYTDFGVDPKKIIVIPNGIDFKQIDQLQAEPLSDYSFSPERNTIISVGRLSAEKNYPLLLHAVQRLREKHSNVDLLILGDGILKSDLQQLCKTLNISEHVSFMGFQPNPYKYLKNSQVFVLTSDYEGFPNSLLEAMYVIGNVISTDCDLGPSEIITNNVDGILTKVGDVNELADALEKMLFNQQFRQEIYRNSRKKIINFSHRKMTADYRFLLER